MPSADPLPPPESPSLHYRLYTFGSDGHVVEVREFQAPTDLAAIIQAGPAKSWARRELWNDGRRVIEFDGLPSLD
jgi:hypothetical protein